MVARKCIQEAVKLVSCCAIHKAVNPRQGITIFWASRVEVCEINVDLPFAIGLFLQNYVGKPLGILDFPDEACIDKFIDFFANDFSSF